MSYHPPDCRCMGTWCRAPYNQPDPGPNTEPNRDLLTLLVKATNPFNRIEDREQDLRRGLRRR